MTFWKNERYRSFERQASGDPIRGLARQDFPWQLVDTKHVDTSGDTWSLEVVALNAGDQDLSGKVQIDLEARALCRLTPERLTALGFQPERLTWLGLDDGSHISKEFELQVRIPLEQLSESAKRCLERLKKYVDERYTDTHKRECIRSLVEEAPVSRFAEGNAAARSKGR